MSLSTSSEPLDDGALRKRDLRFFVGAVCVSTVAVLLLGWLIWFKPASDGLDVNLRFVPALNAGLNGTAATLLVLGFMAIRNNRPRLHRTFMVLAFVASSLFLVGYIAYHAVHGDTVYEGAMRPLYLAVLASHVLLSILLLPLCFTTFYFALSGRFQKHRRLAKVTLPIWLYVSVTGVVIFLMLHA